MVWRIRGLSGSILVLVCVTACVARPPRPLTVSMTYHSDPEGATLYEGGRLWGYTPFTLTYPGMDYPFSQQRCARINPVQVRWASGVTASRDDLQLCPQNGYSQQYVFQRPATPGAEIDASFALQLQSNAIQAQRNSVMQQQADAQDATAVAEFLRAQKAH